MKKIVLSVMTIFIVSCSGNSIYFDLEKKGIISCDDSLISKVLIEEVEGDFDFFSCDLKESRRGIGVKFFNVYKIDNAFQIKNGLHGIVSPYEYRLKPNTNYKITHGSKGDAAVQSIIITTDENGDIIDADVLSCQ